MEYPIYLFLFAIGAIICLVACAVKGGMEHLINFLLRGLTGAVGIHIVNALLSGWGFSVGIGVNMISLLTVAILGIPGFLGLYVLGFYFLM